MNYDPIVDGIYTNFYFLINICISLKQSLTILSSITLKSVETPLILNNIRPHNGKTCISFTFTYNNYRNVTISNGVVAGAFTTVSSLMTAITTALAIVIAAYSG